MTNINTIHLSRHEHINPTILASNMMTLHAPFIMIKLPRNQHMHHLPTADSTRSSQDQIKLGINNTVVISKWPQGAWPLPTILVQHHEYTTTRYPRYHRDPYGDHNNDQHLASNHDPYGNHNPANKWPVILTTITTRPINGPWSLRRSQPDQYMARDPYGDHHPTYLTIIKHIILITVDSWCDLLSTWALIRGRGYR